MGSDALIVVLSATTASMVTALARSAGRNRNTCRNIPWYLSLSPTHSMPIRLAVAAARGLSGSTRANSSTSECSKAQRASARAASVIEHYQLWHLAVVADGHLDPGTVALLTHLPQRLPPDHRVRVVSTPADEKDLHP